MLVRKFNDKNPYMRYKITLSYNGFGTNGWQIQNNAPSIQGELERAVGILTGAPAHTTGAGRTDTGVNAINYTAHFDTDSPFPKTDARKFCYKLNAILPKTITVHSVQQVSEEFHSRFGAKDREYRYFVHRVKDPFVKDFSYQCHFPLDLGKMNEAAACLLGEHDFKCFEKTGGNNKTSICTVTKAYWETYEPVHAGMMGFPHSEGDYLVFHIRADRFLRNMVRAIVGTLIEVGRGKHSPEWVKGLVAEGSRGDSGESVPGNALFFCGAVYDEDE